MSIKQTIKNRLFFLKILKKNFQAKPIRRKEAEQALQLLDKYKSAEKRIVFCGVPTHKNLGDQAQRYCINKWCRENYPDYEIVQISTWPFYENDFIRRFEQFIKNDDIIVVQSGYCTTSRHKDHKMHRYLVSHFPENRILIMPQTVNFAEKRDGIATGKIYNNHANLLFLARDKKSFESAKEYFTKTRVLLYPDIVTSLIGTKEFSGKREGILLCVRNDGEKKYSDQQINALREKLESKGVTCEISDTNSDLPLEELIEKFEQELESTLSYFAKHEVVITDRYHGTIFSMISNTPVIVLETKDHKVKTGTEWFSPVYEGAFYNAKDLNEAYTVALKLLKEKRTVNNPAYFHDEYYAKLKMLFDNRKGNNI